MEKNKELFECKPGECNLTKVADIINSDLEKHLTKHLSTIEEKYPEVHRGCLTKIFAEQLIENGHYLMGKLIAHTIGLENKNDN
ncbi:hypothetical protein [Candidatus Pelagibacter sp.]|uniref:hypothetical protein n=1 Tax=Candidatus Pelagibacter sp. TaxID=2024849 RepID=UPI003F855826